MFYSQFSLPAIVKVFNLTIAEKKDEGITIKTNILSN
jgi:hypothetical protein